MILVWKPNCIVNADSKDLSQIGINKVTLTVTSPPYHNAINYQEHQTSDEWYRGTAGESIDSWLDEMRQVFSEVYKVTKPWWLLLYCNRKRDYRRKKQAASSSTVACRANKRRCRVELF